MATKNVSYRCTDVEYAALEERAKRLGLRGRSQLISRVLRFFAGVEVLREDFWSELHFKARKVGKTPEEYMIDLLARDNPRPKPSSPFLNSEIRMVDEGEYGDSL